MIDQIEPNGIFYRLKSEEKTNFVKNDLYFSILPKDSVEFTKLPNGDVHIDRIVEHVSKLTLGIFDTLKKRLRLPLDNKQFNISYEYTTKLKCRYLFCYVSIEKTDIKIVEEIGDVKKRQLDFEICSRLYRTIMIENDISCESTDDSMYSIETVKDQRELFTFNIDPKDSLDFDDAISVDIKNGIIYVHIVDINTHLKNSNIEKSAFELGQTLYLVEGNIDLFPKNLCEDVFSLVENQERPVITLEYHLDNKDYKLYRSRIIVKKRYDYESAEEALGKGEEVFVFLDKVIQKPDWIYSSFEIPKRKLILSNSEIERIEFGMSNRMNKIIEALMIMTNRKVTEHLDGIIPERYHGCGSSIEKLDLSDIKPENSYIIIEELKRYKLAKYSDTESGHYALEIPLYTHFTSPIRRSFDILIHKIMGGSRYTNRNLTNLIDHMNERQLFSKRLVEFYERCKLMSYLEKTNRSYLMTITKITKHGINIYLADVGYYDFIHISRIAANVRWLYREEKLVGTNGIILEKDKQCLIYINSINWFLLTVEEYSIGEFL